MIKWPTNNEWNTNDENKHNKNDDNRHAQCVNHLPSRMYKLTFRTDFNLVFSTLVSLLSYASTPAPYGCCRHLPASPSQPHYPVSITCLWCLLCLLCGYLSLSHSPNFEEAPGGSRFDLSLFFFFSRFFRQNRGSMLVGKPFVLKLCRRFFS